MKKEIERYLKFTLGIVFCALGIVIILKSQMGLSPWDILNQGLSETMGITFGRANTIVGIIVIAISLKYKQPIGSGTLLNLFLVGEFINFFNDTLIKMALENSSYFIKFPVFLVGVIIFSYGCYLYIKAGIGCGPRDGLLVALTKKTSYSVGLIKSFLEAVALVLGYLLGGQVGVGSIIFTIIVGPIIQFFFKINMVNIKEIRHRSINEEAREIFTFLAHK